MGRALVKANPGEIFDLVQTWITRHKLIIRSNERKADTTSEKPELPPNETKARCAFYSVSWKYKYSNEGLVLDVTIKPRWAVIVCLNTAIIAGLFFAIKTLFDVADNYNLINLSQFLLFAIMTIITIWIKSNYLWLKLTKTENSFWEDVESAYDTKLLIRPQAKLQNVKSRLATEFILASGVIYLSTVMAGIYGLVISLVISLLVLTMGTVESITRENAQWHWRFWIVSNMSKWTWLMLSTLAIVPVLMAFEFFMPLEIYNNPEKMPNVLTAIQQGDFRKITPATAEVLESNAREHIINLAKSGKLKSKTTKLEQEASYKVNLYAGSIFLFIIAAIMVAYFSFRPLRNVFLSHKIWQHEIAKKNLIQAPSVPYLSQAWKWQMPSKFKALILFHYLIGGIVNVAAGVFCFDSISYVLCGHAFFFDEISNLWSWVFADCKILFGMLGGQIAGVIFIFIVGLPLFFLFVIFTRRITANIFILFKVILTKLGSPHHCQTLSSTQEFCMQVCSGYNIKMPAIIIGSNKAVIIKLHYLSFLGKPVIELSKATLQLLSPEELKAAISHELGHIKQGLWKVSILKFLSSLALFPNYYLTLCLDWAKNEIGADRFAVDVTGNAQSLKQALIKISTARISYSTAPKTNTSFFSKPLRAFLKVLYRQYHSAAISIRFFFGDELFGYTHPYLSERLKVIDEAVF